MSKKTVSRHVGVCMGVTLLIAHKPCLRHPHTHALFAKQHMVKMMSYHAAITSAPGRLVCMVRGAWLVLHHAGQAPWPAQRLPRIVLKHDLCPLAHLPDLITLFLPADLAQLQNNNLVLSGCHGSQWEPFQTYLGVLAYSNACLCGNNTWMNALHAAHLRCYVYLCKFQVGWVVLSYSLASSMCVSHHIWCFVFV